MVKSILKIVLSISIGVLSSCLLVILIDRSMSILGFPINPPFEEKMGADKRVELKNIEYKYTVETNSQGIRAEEIPLKNLDGAYRVAVIGDSFVFGQGVEAEETFVRKLGRSFAGEANENMLFIGMGIPGASPINYEALYYHTGLSYELDGLLICIFADDLSSTGEKDISWSLDPDGDPFLPSWRGKIYRTVPCFYSLVNRACIFFRKNAEDFRDRIADIARKKNVPEERIKYWQESLPDRLVSATERHEFNGSLLSYGLVYPEYWSDSLDVKTPMAERKWAVMRKILVDIIEKSRLEYIQPAVVFIPSRLQYDQSFYETLEEQPLFISGIKIKKRWLTSVSELQYRLRSLTDALNVPFLDLTPALRIESASGSDLTFKLDGHWTAEGHTFASNEIEKWIRDKKLFVFKTSSG